MNWSKAEMKPNNKFKCVSNCNYAIELCLKAPLKFSLVGIGGPDINEGHEKFILATVWQMMRYHTIKKLQQMRGNMGGNITDDKILEWANEKVKANIHESKYTYVHMSCDCTCFI